MPLLQSSSYLGMHTTPPVGLMSHFWGQFTPRRGFFPVTLVGLPSRPHTGLQSIRTCLRSFHGARCLAKAAGARHEAVDSTGSTARRSNAVILLIANSYQALRAPSPSSLKLRPSLASFFS